MEKYIGFAIKSNSVIIGIDNILKSNKKIYVVIMDKNLAQNSKYKITNFCEQKEIRVVETDNLEDIVYKTGVKAIAITNENLANQI